MANMIPIYTVIIGAAGSSSIDFINIPQNYTDLLIKISARTTRTGTVGDGINLYLNGLNVAQYSEKTLRGSGSAATSFSETSVAQGYVGRAVSDGSTANTFSNIDIYIPNYSGYNNKTFSADAVTENNGTEAYIEMISNIWANTSAINRVLLTSSSWSFKQYSSATLYGIRRY